jgi:DnaJ like chaperone protein
MSWWGKLLGGTFGYLIGGPLGAMLGAAFGHQFDEGYQSVDEGQRHAADPARVQVAFFTATFAVMGRLAKADGQVSEVEVAQARAVMARMALNNEQQRAAIHLFTQGKQPQFDLAAVVTQLRHECGRRRDLLRMFIEIQLDAMYADGHAHTAERALLTEVCALLGIGADEFAGIEQRLRGEWEFARSAGRGDGLDAAYATLGVTAAADDAGIKRAYRRLMSQHHPDKLVGKGLPDEMVKIATRKTQEIKAAYERVRAARGQ